MLLSAIKIAISIATQFYQPRWILQNKCKTTQLFIHHYSSVLVSSLSSTAEFVGVVNMYYCSPSFSLNLPEPTKMILDR